MKSKVFLLLASGMPLIAAALQAMPPPQGTAATPKSFPLCSGGDDTAMLQAMLDHGNPEMTVVEIPATPTGCLITGPLFVGSNTHVIQNGLLKLDYDWPHPYVFQRGMYTIENNAHDVIIEGSGTLDGGYPDYPATTGECCMGGIVSGTTSVSPVDANVRDITVRGLTVRNMTQWGIALTGATNVRIDGVTVYNTLGSSGVGLDSHDAIVTNSRFYNTRDVCFSMYRGIENVIVSDNIVSDCINGSGISMLSDWADCLPQPPLFGRYAVMNNNIAVGRNVPGTTAGIDVAGRSPDGMSGESASITFSIAHSHALGGFGTVAVRGGLIAGNLTHNHGTEPYDMNGDGIVDTGWPAGINLLGAKGVLVSGNSSFSQGYGPSFGQGLHASALWAEDPIRLTVCGNTIPAMPEFTIEHLAVLDNFYYEANPRPLMHYGIKGSAAAPVTVAGNTYAPLLTASDDFSYGVGSVKADNADQP